MAASYPDAWLAAIVSSPMHLELLAMAATRHQQVLPVMLDRK
jgi:hypothetical protein